MSGFSAPSLSVFRELLLPSLALALLSGCDSSGPVSSGASPAAESTAASEVPEPSNPLSRPLALARLTAARNAPADQALPLLVSALEADSSCNEARLHLHHLLAHTRWHFPVSRLDHPLPVGHIHSSSGSLWVSLSSADEGGPDTTVRWNASALRVESVLFPARSASTRSLTLSPDHRTLVLRRGDGAEAVTLLCDAGTLRPVLDLDSFPDDLVPSSVIVWSPDGLLLAHPSSDSKLWHIRDAATGQIVRSAELETPPTAARWHGQSLHVLHTDGSLSEIPLSPVDPVFVHPPEQPLRVLAAFYPRSSSQPVLLLDQGPHHPPRVHSPLPDPEEDFLGHPWSRHPSLWTGFASLSPLAVDDRSLSFPGASRAPIRTDSEITAAAFHQDQAFIGTADGTLDIHLLLPLPGLSQAETTGIPSSIAPLRKLSDALSGHRLDEDALSFTSLPPADRIEAVSSLSPSVLSAVLPGLDFTPILKALSRHPWREPTPEATALLLDRLARAASSTEAAASLARAFDSDQPALLQQRLDSDPSLPPVLRRLAETRIAWLQGRKADAIAAWPEGLPDPARLRRTEDWDGWEQPDFTPHVASLQALFDQELSPLSLPPSSTPEQRVQLAERLLSPSTRATVGKEPHAAACLAAAHALAAFPEDAPAALQLATLALHLGADPPRCLRAQAVALTATGDFRKSHECWITLITEYPQDSHESGDYAEAAYTAYENGDGGQAMEILSTGLHRFPGDAAFALRAGWVSLLIDQPEPAHRFLLAGRSIGYPAEKQENALALLAIAAVRAGLVEEAWEHFQALVEFDSAWADPTTLETLDWPEDLKSTLRQLTW